MATKPVVTKQLATVGADLTTVDVRDGTYLLAHSGSRLGPDTVGLCEHSKIEGLLSIDPTRRGWEYIDDVVHELAHAFFPDLRETVIIKFANQLTAVLKTPEVMRRGGLK